MNSYDIMSLCVQYLLYKYTFDSKD